MCQLDSLIFLSEIEDLPTRRATYIGSALEYACQFWTNHLAMVPSSSLAVEEVDKAIEKFFTTHFLFWVEVLSLMGKLGVGVYALNDIQQWYIIVSYM